MAVRAAAVAGMFYPAEPERLKAMVDDFLAKAPHSNSAPPKAIIAPHAGYIYSGPIAAYAYRALAPLRETITRVVLLGPSHRVALPGLAVSSAEAFETPLGTIPLERQTLDALLDLPQVCLLNEAHTMEHSLEVQLPFLQTVLGDFTLLPLAVGDAEPDEVAQVLERLWGGPETVIVISSDLSHYHDYQTAQRMDRRTSNAIVHLDGDKIGYDDACGRAPIRGLLQVARNKALHAELLQLANSGDTAGDRDQVVGYGAYAFN